MKTLATCCAALLFGFAASAAPIGRIYPEPQKILSEPVDQPAAQSKTTVVFHSVNGEAQFDMGSELYLSELGKLGENSAAKPLEIHAGLLSDPEMDALFNYHLALLPPQGYSIRIISSSADKTVVAIGGADARGVLYGFCSLAQLLTTGADGKAVQRLVNVDDYPVWRSRFISDYFNSETLDGYKFAVANKISGVAAILQDNWRKPEWWEKIKPTLAAMKEMHDAGALEFMMLIHVYRNNKEEKQLNIASDQEVGELIDACRRLAESGATYIMIGADDITPLDIEKGYLPYHQEELDRFGSIGAAHGYLMKRLYDSLIPDYPDLKLSMVGAPYSIGHGIGRKVVDQYMIDWGKNAPKEVMWVWTGKGVFSPEVNSFELKKITDLLSGQKVFLFDNSNGFYSPLPRWETKFYPGMELDNEGIVYLNGCFFQTTVRNQEALRFLTTCDYLWNPAAYNPQRSYDTALEILFGKAVVAPVNRLREIMISYDNAEYSGDRSKLAGTADEFAAALETVKKLRDPDGQPLRIGLDRIAKRVERARTFEKNVAPEAEIHAATAPVKLDGDITEAEWGKAAIIKLENADGTPDAAPTVARVMYAPEGAYIAFEIPASEPLPELGKLRHDEAAYASPDAVEVFLQLTPDGPDNLASYAHYCFDYAGNKFEEIPTSVQWQGDWDVAVKPTATGWNAELLIKPVPGIRSTRSIQEEDNMYWVEDNQGLKPEVPAAGQVWKANFHRVENRTEKVQSWGKNGFKFHLPGYFGKLILK
ncbi:MAG: beta-N-acetylglucosaminidase domain-containing protein [Victivallaceae bacterium]|nr:beta-N-acetylglucosaminidase domain-containing protein [Victivallaceae bacterium]